MKGKPSLGEADVSGPGDGAIPVVQMMLSATGAHLGIPELGPPDVAAGIPRGGREFPPDQAGYAAQRDVP